MKTLLLPLLLLVVALPASASDGIHCNPNGNQSELNKCASDEQDKADAALNAVYRQVLQKNAGHPVALEKIRAAQRLWIQLRDADLAARYPVGKNEDPRMLYGSIYPMVYAQARAELSRTRTTYLRKEFFERSEYDL